MSRTPRFAVSTSRVQASILLVRGQKVLLDVRLAALDEVHTKALNRAVRRNIGRFPSDFMFDLTEEETEILRCQFGTSRWGGLRYRPHAFTEQGVAMLSSVLRSPRAIAVNVAIMRVFVRMRTILMTSDTRLARRIAALEKRMSKQDARFTVVFDALRDLLEDHARDPAKRIGFR